MTKFKHEIKNQVRELIGLVDDVTVWHELQRTKAKLAKATTTKHKARVASVLAMWVAEAKRRGITGTVDSISICQETGITYRS